MSRSFPPRPCAAAGDGKKTECFGYVEPPCWPLLRCQTSLRVHTPALFSQNTLLNQVFVFAYTSLGFTASEIYEWYYGERLPPSEHRKSAAHRVKHERAAHLLTQASTPAEHEELQVLRRQLWAQANERKPVIWQQAARYPALLDAAPPGGEQPVQQTAGPIERPTGTRTPPRVNRGLEYGTVPPVDDVMPEAAATSGGSSSAGSSAVRTPDRRERYRDILDQMSTLTARLESQLSPGQSRLPSPEPTGDMAEVE